MISALRRDGLVISSSLARSHSNAARLPRHNHILRQHAVVSNGQRAYSVVATRPFSWSSQRLSPLPVRDEKLTKSAGAPPPISLKKHKVDLKPGPVKPQTSEVRSFSPPSSPNTLESAGAQSKRAESSQPHVDTTSGVIETAKHDFAEASQHGILAPAPEGSSRIYTLYHQAKELFKFYMRGLKLIFTNRRRATEMLERVQTGGPPLTRWETKFIRTCHDDIVKLIPFAMIILVLEEIIPLVVLYAPFILPSTCILPSQKDRIDSKKREKQRVLVSSHREVFSRLATEKSAEATVDSSLASVTLKPLSGVLGLSTFTPQFLQLRALKRHLEMITKDDALLLRERNGSHLTPSELRQALFDRGILTDELPEDMWRSRLDWWLENAAKLSGNAAVDAASERLRLVARGALSQF